MFLEAQFGADAVAPIERPKMLTSTVAAIPSSDSPASTSTPQPADPSTTDPTTSPPSSPSLTPDELAELSRLHSLGIPVPGISIRVDKLSATVWLEDLSVECGHAVLRDRVGKVVERAIECVSGLWV